MGEEGTYEGYRYATMAELDQLIINFGYVAVNTECQYTAMHCDTGRLSDSALIETMIHTLGDTLDPYLDEVDSPIDIAPGAAGYTQGILGTQHYTATRYDRGFISDSDRVERETGDPDSDFRDEVRTAHGAVSSGYRWATVGSFLVAEVPIPAAGWLFISALAGLVGKKRLSRRLVG